MYINEDHILIRDFKENDIKNKIEWINDPRNNTFLHYDIPLNYKDTLNWYKTKDKSKRIDCIIEYDSIPVGLEQEGFFVQDLLHNNKLIDRKRYAIIRQNFSERNL